MPAFPPDIVRATRRARTVLHEVPANKTAFPRAGDQAQAPEPGFFVNAADAAAVLAIKAGLTATFRRRFTVTVDGLVWPDPATGIPTYQLVDAELDFDGPCLVARIVVDLENEQTRMELIG